jgi:hypothetical protein
MFALNPLQAKVYTDAPFYYHNGVNYLNAETRIFGELFVNGDPIYALDCDGESIIGKSDGVFSLGGYADAPSDSVPAKVEDGGLNWVSAQTLEVVTDVTLGADGKLQVTKKTIKFYGEIEEEIEQ